MYENESKTDENIKRTEGYVLKEITPGDSKVISQIAKLEQDIFPDAWSENAIMSTVSQPGTLCTALMDQDELLGYYLCYYVLDECEIARIAVAPNARRRGFGQMLFDQLCRECRERELYQILLDVRAGNKPAIAFYRKNGFTQDGIRKDYYAGESPEDAVLMSCDLN